MRVVPNTAMRSVLYFCGYCGVDTAHGVCVAASTVGATMPSTLWPRQGLAGSHFCCRWRAATAVAVLQPSRTSLQPLREQRFDAGARQIDDLGRGAVAVGHVGVVAQVEKAACRGSGRRARAARSARRGRNRRRRSCACVGRHRQPVKMGSFYSAASDGERPPGVVVVSLSSCFSASRLGMATVEYPQSTKCTSPVTAPDRSESR